ncbi:hypothetical protein AbraCBS73388_000140 [Aspergillus brasiliensis]|uniref:Uncharacterized protein n=1 Tax=Aspergillus brasiliensis TaxID=319629 RepID=A0A9W5YFG9_9EURO|nr:hypothetical protein AbraCBS73388_000140 [Aspergillus brasiliensis]
MEKEQVNREGHIEPVNDSQTLSDVNSEGRSEQGSMQLYDRVERLSVSLCHELSTLRGVSVDRRDAIGSMRQEIARLKQRNRNLEEQLQDCQARILKFSLPSDLSDTTVLQEFVKIRDNLSNWTEGLPEICKDFDTQLECALEVSDCYRRIYGDVKSFPQGLIGVQSELLMHIVFCRLGKGLLESLVPGMLVSDEALLSDLHAGLSSLQPEGGAESRSQWSSNTIRAYVACQRYQQGVDNECWTVINDLQCLFACFDFEHDVNWNSKMERLMDDILKPTASLATKMASSPSQYRWEWYGKAFFPQQVVRKQHVEQFIVQDACTHQRIPIAKFASFPDDTPVGELLVIIFPALFRRGENGHGDIQIEKAVILIRANENLRRQKRSENRSRMFGRTVLQMFKESALGQLD